MRAKAIYDDDDDKKEEEEAKLMCANFGRVCVCVCVESSRVVCAGRDESAFNETEFEILPHR